MILIGLGCLGLTAAAQTGIGADPAAVLRRTLAAEEQRNGLNSPLLLPTIDKLAQAQWRGGDFAETAALQRRALDIAIDAYGCGSTKAAEAMTALAQTDIDRRRYLDAEPLLIAALNVLDGSDASDNPARATVFAALARIAIARGLVEAAGKWADQAVAAAAKDARAAPPLLAMAAVRAAEERFAESEQLIRDALARDRERDGPQSVAAARALSQLGNLYLRQKRYGEALPPLEEAATIDQQALAPAHPFVADDFYELGLVFDGLKRAREAHRSLAIAVKLLQQGSEKNGLRPAYAERELARVLRASGKTKEADAASEDSKRILDKAEDDERDRERQT